METQVCGGKRVMERSLLNLVEQLMTQLIKLDEIVGDGDVKVKRRLQVGNISCLKFRLFCSISAN